MPSLKRGAPDRPPSLPPFAQLEAVAQGEYPPVPPLSPMSFVTPVDDDSESYAY